MFLSPYKCRDERALSLRMKLYVMRTYHRPRHSLKIWVQISFYRLTAYASSSSFDFIRMYPLAIGLQRVLLALFIHPFFLIEEATLLRVFSCGTESYFAQTFSSLDKWFFMGQLFFCCIEQEKHNKVDFVFSIFFSFSFLCCALKMSGML